MKRPLSPNHPIVIRSLNNIEQAFTISNAAHPLCVVIVLPVKPAPDPEKLRSAAIEVQKRHALLQVRISKVNGDLKFVSLDQESLIPVEIFSRDSDASWKAIAERELNTTFPVDGPLMKFNFGCDSEQNAGEIVISFHHAIIDGNSARLILHEVLSILGNQPLPNRLIGDDAQAAPAIRPKNLYRSIFKFFKQQLPEEWHYRRKGFLTKPTTHSKNKVICLRISPDMTMKLNRFCGSKRLNLNNLLLAALTLAILKNKYPDKKSGPVRVINFANFGLSLSPPVRPEDLGCYISMLRLTIPFNEESNVTSMAADIRRALISNGRANTIKLMAWLSKYLVQLTFKLRNARMGVSALSFIGVLDLSPLYGSLNLLDVKAFISNNQYGPEFSGFGKILHNKIGLDFNYLSAETTDEQAARIVSDLENMLSELVNFS